MTKMTINEQFAELRAIVESANIDAEKRDRLVTFIDGRIAQVTAKNSKRSTKPTKNQLENIALMDAIYEAMEPGKAYRVSELGKMDFLADFTINKVNALVRGLKLDGRVIKNEVKGIAYFTKA